MFIYLLTYFIPPRVTLTNSDPRWVGAWWLGFVIAMGLGILLIIPLLALPRELPSEYVVHRHSTTWSTVYLASVKSEARKFHLYWARSLQMPFSNWVSSWIIARNEQFSLNITQILPVVPLDMLRFITQFYFSRFKSDRMNSVKLM